MVIAARSRPSGCSAAIMILSTDFDDPALQAGERAPTEQELAAARAKAEAREARTEAEGKRDWYIPLRFFDAEDVRAKQRMPCEHECEAALKKYLARS
jgi:hypothetical protein